MARTPAHGGYRDDAPAGAFFRGRADLKAGDLMEGMVLRSAKDSYAVLVGTATGKLSFDDLAWAKRQLKGRILPWILVVNRISNRLLKPGDVIEVAVKKVTKEGLQLALEQTPIVEGGSSRWIRRPELFEPWSAAMIFRGVNTIGRCRPIGNRVPRSNR